MFYNIKPGERHGTVTAPLSKSVLHRYLICAALSKDESTIECGIIPDDIRATLNVLSIFADITVKDGICRIVPKKEYRDGVTVDCSDSGSTLRFLLPVCAAFGKTVYFKCSKALMKRPIAPLCDELIKHGAEITTSEDGIKISGKLQAGDYVIPGDISSQFVSGLLFALPLIYGNSTLNITGKIESKPYIELTKSALRLSGIDFSENGRKFTVKGNQCYNACRLPRVEGDYSSAAFFLCLGALSEKGVTVSGLTGNSLQGDRRITDILKCFGADITVSNNGITAKKKALRGITVDAADIPDLVPVISVVAAVSNGTTVIKNAARLSFKESNRLESTAKMINSLGGNVTVNGDGLIIKGVPCLSGGETDSFSDHRIAMSAAVAATVSTKSVTINGAECTDKSYKNFWDIFNSLEV